MARHVGSRRSLLASRAPQPLLLFDFVRGVYVANGVAATSPSGIPGWSFSGGAVTGTGATGATATDASGVVRLFASGAPRITSAGLDVWQAATNLTLQSQALATAPWTTSNSTAANNAVIAPDGTTTASSAVENSATSSHFVTQPQTFSATLAYTISAFVENHGARYVTLVAYDGVKVWGANFDLQSGVTAGVGQTSGVSAPTSTITAVARGYYKVTMTFTTSSSAGAGSYSLALNTGNTFVTGTNGGSQPTYAGNGTSGAYWWGVQLEQNSFPTPYIPTTSAAVTRSADNASIPGSFWAASGTVLASYTLPAFASGSSFARGAIIGPADNAGNNSRMMLRGNDNTTSPSFAVGNGSSVSTLVDTTVAAGSVIRVGGAWSPLISTLEMQGRPAVTGGNGWSAVVPATTGIGSLWNSGFTSYLNGNVRAVKVLARPLSAGALPAAVLALP